MKRLPLLIAVAALSLVIMITGCSNDTPQTAIIGKPAPNITLPDTNSNSVSLEDFKGRPMLINFWKIKKSERD